MCIQQPQDSSQRSAVIAHYNQSSWARLSSPFGIKNGGKNHKTKPQSSADTSPAVCPTQISTRGAKWKDRALQQGLYIENYKAQGQDMVAGEGTRMRHACLHTACSYWVSSSCPWDSAQVPEHGRFLTGHRSWCKLQGKRLPHHAGLPTPAVRALPAPGFTSTSPEAKAEPEQRRSNEQRWE